MKALLSELIAILVSKSGVRVGRLAIDFGDQAQVDHRKLLVTRYLAPP